MKYELKHYLDSDDWQIRHIKNKFVANEHLYGVATKLDKQINDYLGQLNPKQKKAVLTVVKTFAEEQQESDLWEDDAFIAELDRRTKDYEAGKAKVYTLDQMEAKVRKEHKSKGKIKR